MAKARPSSRALDSSPILSRLRPSRSRLRYQNKSTHARNPASYAAQAKLYPKHYVSFSLTDYPIAKDYQNRPQNPQPNVPTENVEVNPIYEYFLLFYRRINMAVLNYIGMKSSHIPFTFITRNLIGVYSRSNLIGVTYIHRWSMIHWTMIHWTMIHLPITCPTRRLRGIFFYKKITQ